MPDTALITGASAGLGAEFARQLAPRCRTLILVARRGDRLASLAAELLAACPGLTVFPYEADLTDEARIDALVRWLDESGLEVDFLVNNAGLGDHGRFVDGDWDRVRSMIALNVTALTKLTFLLLPRLVERPRAAILNVSSVASLIPLPQLAVYAATKAFVTSLSEALRAELRGTRVSVTALCPGPVETEFGSVARRLGQEDEMISPDFFKVPAAQVVREAIKGAERDRARVIPGLLVAVVMTLAASLPLFLLRPLLNRKA